MSEEIDVPADIAKAFEDYQQAKQARARWAEEEKAIRQRILAHLGYDDEDPKPLPVTAVSGTGAELFKVSVGNWRGMDFNHLREHYPDVYAICERSRPTLTLKPA